MSLYVNIVKKLKDYTLHVAFETSKDEGITGILGSSGCGKSVTLKCIAGIMTPDFGRIVLNGHVLFDSEQKINVKIQDRGVGYLFQNYALFPHMTARKNIEMAVSGTAKEKQETAKTYLKMFHIEELADNYPGKLSGGQQQRIALARIMASRPSVLMLDEPFSALDYDLKEKLQLELLEELNSYDGDILLVTHSRDEIYRFCEKIHVINEGSIVVSGGVAEVFKEPKTVSAAKLTGCKNIVRFRYEEPHRFYVPDWDIWVIMKGKEVPKEAEYIGIRAHYLTQAVAGQQDNVMECGLNRLLDDPFEVTLILENGIWWKIPKERWKQEFHEKLPERLAIPEESIFFLMDR